MSEHSKKPVFFDPEFRRWTHFTRGVKISLGLGAVIFGVLLVNLFITPVLPALRLSAPKSPSHGHAVGPNREKEPRPVARKKVEPVRRDAKMPESTPVQTASDSNGRPLAIGFFVNWDDTSFTSLKHNADRLDVLVPEWLHLADADGTIVLDDPERQKQVVAFVKATRPDLKIVPLVNNFISERMEWQDRTIARMLASPDARARVVAQLLDYVTRNGFAGISVDFENIPPASQPNLQLFMAELGTAFHAKNLEVTMNVPLADEHFNYKAYAAVCDQLILMAYDEHWSESTAGPVASRKWFNDAVRKRFAELPPQKFIVALGNYGYDWKGGESKATEITYQEAMQTAKDSEGRISLDPASFNPTYDYYDDADALHHVWFLDAVTTFNQMAETTPLRPYGYALWRLGAEDPSIWGIFRRTVPTRDAAVAALRTIHYGYDIDYEGQGEILKVVESPRDGTRDIEFDAGSGLVTGERVATFASPYVIQRWGGSERKKIALTFDDGPDPEFTPKVLDVLKENHVPATFFIVGNNANLHPELLRRMAAEGHEIGNHTFTHPNISVIGDEQVAIELNATQRLLESQIGRRTVLFRPPYAEDVEPENPEQVKPLLEVGQRGYFTVGMQIDPNDWKSPGADAIVAAVLEQAEAGQGNIVLLHDSGGDRSQTVAALPRIIRELRAKGYELVPVSSLIGVPREAVMPIVPPSEKVAARVDDAGFSIIGFGGRAIRWLFLLGIVLGVARLGFVSALALYARWRGRLASGTGSLPRVSVIVPAYNEEKVVCETVASLLVSDYEDFDVIVVDDGSTDETFARVLERFGDHPKVKAYTKPNGGKSAALNFGIAHSDAEVIVALDADTVFNRDTLRILVSHFEDPAVGAVAGNAKVGNRVNLMTRWQALEYITSQNLDRRAYEVLNCISVVPGAIGAWRREPVVAAGGFTGETLAEDADLTISILRMGYRIRYEDRAVAHTEAPDTVGAFLKQRFRWMYGTLQAVWKHRDLLLRRKAGALGLFALPNVLVFQIFFPLISPVMDAMMIGSLADAVWQRTQHPEAAMPDGLWRSLMYYGLFLSVDFGAALLAFLLEPKEDKRLLWRLFPQRFFYRQLMYYVAIKSILTAIRGSLVGWGKLERKATVRMNQT